MDCAHLVHTHAEQFVAVGHDGVEQDEERREIAAMLSGRADVVLTHDRSSGSSTRELPRSTAIGLLAAGAAVALVYAQLVL